MFLISFISRKLWDCLFLTHVAVFVSPKSLSLCTCVCVCLMTIFLYPQSKAQGRKNVVEINKLEEGVSYCFTVAAYIPSRKSDHQMGSWSIPVCWPPKAGSFFEGKYHVRSALLSLCHL